MIFIEKVILLQKKVHKCDLCRKYINKGEKYINVVCKCTYEDLFTAKYHLTCSDLVERYQNTLDYDDFFNETDVIDSIHDRVCCDCEKSCDYKYYDVSQCPIVISKYLIKNRKETK